MICRRKGCFPGKAGSSKFTANIPHAIIGCEEFSQIIHGHVLTDTKRQVISGTSIIVDSDLAGYDLHMTF